MSAPFMCFDDPNRTDGVIAVEPDSQTVVRPGDRPNTATVISPDGTMVDVRGEVADVHLQIRQRKKLGIGQRKAAKLWGFDDSTIQAWEHERRQPQGLYREKLEEVLRRVEDNQARSDSRS